MGRPAVQDQKSSSFPATFPPRGMSRIDSAHYIGVSPALFDEMVRDGRMPQPKIINSRVLWDRMKLEAFFDALPERGEAAAGDSFADWR